MTINEDELKKDINILRKKMMFPKSMSEFSKAYIDFLSWIDVYNLAFGKNEDENICVSPYIQKGLYKQDKRDQELLSEFFDESSFVMDECSVSYKEILKNINFIDFNRTNNGIRYNYLYVKELILSFFSMFDSNTLKFAKEALNSRCHSGEFLNECSGSCSTNYSLGKCIILIENDNFTINDMAILVHEIGHYIEISKYLRACSRVPSLYSNAFVELPSEFYEYEFLKYLKTNHINLKETNNMINYYYGFIDYCFNSYKYLSDNNFDDSLALIDSIIYSLGSYTALHFSILREKDIKEFNKRFNVFNSQIGISGIDTLLEISGFEIGKYLNGNYISDLITKDYSDIKRVYRME